MFNNLHWAFEDRSLVLTDYGPGIQHRRRGPDLVLTTGELTLGLPGPDQDTPRLTVPPGTYPVYLSVQETEVARATVPRLLFVRVALRDEVPTVWELVGRWFTDAGTGFLCDASRVEALSFALASLEPDVFDALRESSLHDPPGGGLELGPGGNALVFRTTDGYLPLLAGLDDAGALLCAVVAVYQDNHEG